MQSPKKKKGFLKIILLLCILALVLAGCAGGGRMGRKKGKSEVSPANAGQAQSAEVEKNRGKKIAYLTFSPPEQVRWVENDDPALRNSGVAEWMVEGSSAESTPARVMYQKLMPVQDASTLKAQILKPLAGCPDSKVQDLQLGSKYRDQLGFQATCSKLGTQDYGLIDYVAIFSDGVANHVMLAEVKTPPSNKVGVLDSKSAEVQKQAQTSKNFADMLSKAIRSVRVCNEQELCI